jgi:hypothetical protein
VLGLFKKAKVVASGPGPFGRFQLHELVASGGMADIWLAADGQGKFFALRRLLDSLQGDSTAKMCIFTGWCALQC